MPPARAEVICYLVDCSNKFQQRLNLLQKIFSLKVFDKLSSKDVDKQKLIFYNHPDLDSIHEVNGFDIYNFEVFNKIKDQTSKKSKNKETVLFTRAVLTAIDAIEDVKFPSNYIKRIVLISDVSNNYDDKSTSEIKSIIDRLIGEKIWLYVVGLKINMQEILKYESEIPSKLKKIEAADELSLIEKSNYSLLTKLQENVIFADEKHGIDVIFCHKPEPKLPFPWYVRMNIGNLQIPIHAHRTTRKLETIKLCPVGKLMEDKDEKVWYDLNTHKTVDNEDVVRGYAFHGEIVYTTEQFKKIEIPKCLTIFGFADAEEAPINLLIMGDSIACIRRDPRIPKTASDRHFSLFATAMRVKKVVALAYRVYNNNNQRKFYGIFPCPDHEDNDHLLMGQIPFANELEEGFRRGKVEEDYKSETFQLMSNFLNDLYPQENKFNLYPLPYHLQVEGSRARKAEFLIKKYLKEDPGKPAEVCMDPILQNRAASSAEALLQEILSE